VETSSAEKKLLHGFQIFLSDLKQHSEAWRNFQNKHSHRAKDMEEGLRRCFEHHYAILSIPEGGESAT
jgi:hypothetical protein